MLKSSVPVLLLSMALGGLPAAAQAYSSSAADDASETTTPAAAYSGAAQNDKVHYNSVRPFRSVALAFEVGAAGIGFDVATPLNSFLHLRSGGQFFSHSLNPNANGLHTLGELTLQTVHVSVDVFPFRNSSFHISPGVTVHNDNHLASSLFVRPGATFSLGDADYLSDPNFPITGNARVKLGSQVAPRVTIGWGNMLPRKGSNFSVPFDVGFQYISSPTLDLVLYGNACDNMGNCGDINQSDGPQNIKSEVQQLNTDIAGLRFYPLISIGLSYRFGH